MMETETKHMAWSLRCRCSWAIAFVSVFAFFLLLSDSIVNNQYLNSSWRGSRATKPTMRDESMNDKLPV